MKKLFSVCVATLVLAGCSSALIKPDPYYAAPVVDVTEGNSNDYWVAARNRLTLRSGVLPSRSQPCSFVKLRFTIDSNGNTFDPEVVEAWPNDKFVPDAIKLVSMQKFRPAETNVERVPVRMNMTSRFVYRDVSCEGLRPEFAGGRPDEAS